MTPDKIALLLTVLAAVVVVLTRVRLSSQSSAGRLSVSSMVAWVHTLAGTGAILLWSGMLITGREDLGWLSLPLWWVTVFAGLLVLVRWLPARGRHSADPVGDSWGEGPGLSILAHVGMLVGVLIFTFYLVFDKLPV